MVLPGIVLQGNVHVCKELGLCSVLLQGILGRRGLGGACRHIKAFGPVSFPIP